MSPLADWGGPCAVCGWCDVPGGCVWSVACPRCEAAAGEQCRARGQGKLEGLHAERWDAAGRDYCVDAPWLLIYGEPGRGKTYMPGVPASALAFTIEEWESLRSVEEAIADMPSGVDARVIDSLTELQRRILEEVEA